MGKSEKKSKPAGGGAVGGIWEANAKIILVIMLVAGLVTLVSLRALPVVPYFPGPVTAAVLAVCILGILWFILMKQGGRKVEKQRIDRDALRAEADDLYGRLKHDFDKNWADGWKACQKSSVRPADSLKIALGQFEEVHNNFCSTYGKHLDRLQEVHSLAVEFSGKVLKEAEVMAVKQDDMLTEYSKDCTDIVKQLQEVVRNN